MCSKSLFIFLVIYIVSDYSYGQCYKKYFRQDYSYVEAVNNFYKIHTYKKSWLEAKTSCELEGASLFYPENDNEAHAVISFWNSTQHPLDTVYVGISDPVVKGVYDTIDGTPLLYVYNKWSPGEPNNEGGEEGCVTLRRSGTLNDVRCASKYPFICKKSCSSLYWHYDCDMLYSGYDFNQQIGRCYKFHSTPLKWTDAYAACRAQQSYLAVINTQLEADYLVNMTKNALGYDFNGAVHLGFHIRFGDWITARGTTLSESGYTNWSVNQPDGMGREQCGSMFYNGTLNDLSCDTRSYYICEREINTNSTESNAMSEAVTASS